MNRSAKRIIAVAIITVVAVLLGFAVDLAWSALEKHEHPDDYITYVKQYASEYNIPEPVILAVIKVESDFDRNALSSAGAMGLMQMMPKTFEWLTGEEHLDEGLEPDELFEPEVSIRYGVYYLNYLYEKFNRNMDTALAAYNGGEGNVAKWLSSSEHSDGKGNLTNIPFSETKNYVEKVNKEIATYKELYYKDQIEVEVAK